jgi:hypothetical protein
MEFTIQRGTLVTLIQVLLVVTFFAAPNHVYWYDRFRFAVELTERMFCDRLAIHINLTKLYANAFCEFGLSSPLLSASNYMITPHRNRHALVAM